MSNSMEHNDQLTAALELFDEFELESTNLPSSQEDAFFKMLNYLTEEVNHLLSNNVERLFWVCYRVDVPENTILEIISNTEISNPAEEIASRLLKRQMEKVETKRKFSKPVDEDVEDDLKW